MLFHLLAGQFGCRTRGFVLQDPLILRENLLLRVAHFRHPWRSQVKEGVWEVGHVPTFAFLGLE